ncbi:MAG: NADH-quinone oxidoreductase subunit L [Bacteroidia bacterium]|nr:NADH-quinone oxidoreductase subunit L [Bacteroidia bacterium]
MHTILQIAPQIPDWKIYPGLIAFFLPFLSFIAAFILGKKYIRPASQLALILMVLAFGMAILQCLWGWESPIHKQFTWLEFSHGEFPLKLTGGIYLDKLSLALLALVTGISSLVLLFSQVYMDGERHLDRYWAYLSFFVFSMLGIVLSDNLLFVFIFWELVGLSSYLLIGFWFEKEAASKASQKAFVLNRIGDVLFLSGMLIIHSQCHTLDIEELITFAGNAESLSESSQDLLSLGGLLLIGGAIGKSAQFPLQVWLPDAMEGPTPVSSLIHAATMVAAGVYLLARYHFLLGLEAQMVILVIGALTSIMAALAAAAQWDIKKVLAYSTLSQLGYMMIGLGLGAWSMALFHLFTHAFFKCALFLVAGVIIHENHTGHPDSKQDIPPENDMRLMGNLRRKFPWLFRLYLPPMLALAGLPLFSGFLSKDGIILASFEWASNMKGNAWLIPTTALITSYLTAFYIGRQAMLVFGGPDRDMAEKHPLSWKMLLPIGILSIFSLSFIFSINPLDGEHSWLLESFSTLFGDAGHREPPFFELILAASILLPFLGLGRAYFLYRNGFSERSFPGFNLLSTHFFQDWVYENIFAKIILFLSNLLDWLDRNIVEGFFTLFSRITVNKSPETDSLGELSELSDKGIDQGLDKLGHLLGPSLATLSSRIDHSFIDGLVNGLVGLFRGAGKRTDQSQKNGIQAYLTGIVLSLLFMLGFIFWIIFK